MFTEKLNAFGLDPRVGHSLPANFTKTAYRVPFNINNMCTALTNIFRARYTRCVAVRAVMHGTEAQVTTALETQFDSMITVSGALAYTRIRHVAQRKLIPLPANMAQDIPARLRETPIPTFVADLINKIGVVNLNDSYGKHIITPVLDAPANALFGMPPGRQVNEQVMRSYEMFTEMASKAKITMNKVDFKETDGSAFWFLSKEDLDDATFNIDLPFPAHNFTLPLDGFLRSLFPATAEPGTANPAATIAPCLGPYSRANTIRDVNATPTDEVAIGPNSDNVPANQYPPVDTYTTVWQSGSYVPTTTLGIRPGGVPDRATILIYGRWNNYSNQMLVSSYMRRMSYVDMYDLIEEFMFR